MTGPEIKHPYSGKPLPGEVWSDPGRIGWYFREKMPDSVAVFRRADLPATDAQALANENVRALVDAVSVQASLLVAGTASTERAKIIGQRLQAALAALEKETK